MRLNADEQDFLLDLVDEDNARVNEEADGDGWVTYYVSELGSGPELYVKYDGVDGTELTACFILVYQPDGD